MTNTGYRALLAQREALEQQIEELRNAERGDAIEWIRQQMALFDVKPEDLDPRRGRCQKNNRYPSPLNTATRHQARRGVVVESRLDGSGTKI